LTGCVATGWSAAVTTALLVVVSMVLVPAGVVVAQTARAYGVAAAGRRQRRDACPFDDDDDDARPLVREIVDVVRESGALVVLLLSGLRPLPRAWRGDRPRPGDGPLVVLVPERGLPVGSLASLGRRFASDLGASVHVEPRGGGDEHVRADRLADRLTALAATAPGRPIVLIGHGAGGRVARRADASVRLPGLRLVTIATAHATADTASAAERPDAINLYSLHDAIVAPATRAYLPGAYNIALRDEGHFGLVLAARPYVLLRESLADVLPSAAS
jgi:hypothetical protein